MSTPVITQRTVLVVDDDSCARKICQRYLANSGLSCLLAGDGHDAVTRYEASILRGEIACLVTDVHMPHMDGFLLAAHVRRLRPSLPIVFLTGETQDRRLVQEIFIEKPMALKELLRIINDKIGVG